MDSRKYSTGTKGRLKMHADQCREFIRANCPNFSLATEFIESIDPERDDSVWQRFQSPEDTLSALKTWLGESLEMPTPAAPPKSAVELSRHPKIQTASQLAADVALRKTREWIEREAKQLASLSPKEAAMAAVLRFHEELTGKN
jgi:hypothetical protein